MKKSIVVKLCIVVACVACVGALAACSCSSDSATSGSSSSGVAATVNGEDIMEDTITNAIQKDRASRGLSDDEEWAEYLSEHGETPAEIREEFIDEYAMRILVEQECAERDITVSSEEVDRYVDDMRDYYDCTTDEEWDAFLADQNMTDEDYRSNVENSFLKTRLKEDLSDDAASDDTGDSADADDSADASSGEGEEASPEDDTAEASSDKTDVQDDLYDDWQATAKEKADIVINEMPQGLPYDVDMSKYDTSE